VGSLNLKLIVIYSLYGIWRLPFLGVFAALHSISAAYPIYVNIIAFADHTLNFQSNIPLNKREFLYYWHCWFTVVLGIYPHLIDGLNSVSLWYIAPIFVKIYLNNKKNYFILV